VQLAESNKMTFDSDCINDLDRDYVSYHFESHKFSEFLRERYKNKITYIVDDVVDFSQNEFGIDLIKCKNSGEIKADLYVDCTGFKSLLIKNFSKFKKYDTLKNNRAVVSPVEYLNNDKEMVPYTNCTALSSGWVWETPTWSRKGMGYVYSTDFISDDDAKNEFIKFIGREVDVRFVDIRSGVMEKGWCKNVVSIGLSYGFIEPLESTGLATTQEAILKLVNAITCRDGYVNYFDIEKYNTSLNNQITAMKNFTEIHYAMSDREDTPYWKYVTNSIDYSSDYLLGLFDLLSSFYHEVSFDNCFPAIYIFAGMGYSLNNKILDQKYEKNYYNLIQKQMCDKSFSDWVSYSNTLKKQIKKLKSHYEFLKENIYI
jgi:tryptophan halogenase